jgi:hypothetical protein
MKYLKLDPKEVINVTICLSDVEGLKLRLKKGEIIKRLFRKPKITEDTYEILKEISGKEEVLDATPALYPGSSGKTYIIQKITYRGRWWNNYAYVASGDIDFEKQTITPVSYIEIGFKDKDHSHVRLHYSSEDKKMFDENVEKITNGLITNKETVWIEYV